VQGRDFIPVWGTEVRDTLRREKEFHIMSTRTPQSLSSGAWAYWKNSVKKQNKNKKLHVLLKTSS
jgi:hypothetical protein